MLCDALYSLFDTNHVEVIKYVYIEKPYPIPSVNNNKEAKIKEVNPIKDDAIKCLVSLGMKKLDANKKVKDMFNNKDYKSIEDFLIDVYKIN